MHTHRGGYCYTKQGPRTRQTRWLVTENLEELPHLSDLNCHRRATLSLPTCVCLFTHTFFLLTNTVLILLLSLSFLFRNFGCAGSSLQHLGSLVAALGLGCSMACGILVPWPGIELKSPSKEGGFLTTGPPGNPLSPCWNSFLQSRQARALSLAIGPCGLVVRIQCCLCCSLDSVSGWGTEILLQATAGQGHPRSPPTATHCGKVVFHKKIRVQWSQVRE